MISTIAAELQRRGSQLSGSFLSVPAHRRPAAAKELVAAGAFIHADVFDNTFTLKSGASPELILELSAQWPARLDVHLMSANPLQAIEHLKVAVPIARTTVHVRPGQMHRLRPALATKTVAHWISVDINDWSVQQLRRRLASETPDGVIVMLAPPGVPHQRADYRILDSPHWRVIARVCPIGVDGGVTADRIDQLARSDARYVVMGRSLFDNHRHERPIT